MGAVSCANLSEDTVPAASMNYRACCFTNAASQHTSTCNMHLIAMHRPTWNRLHLYVVYPPPRPRPGALRGRPGTQPAGSVGRLFACRGPRTIVTGGRPGHCRRSAGIVRPEQRIVSPPPPHSLAEYRVGGGQWILHQIIAIGSGSERKTTAHLSSLDLLESYAGKAITSIFIGKNILRFLCSLPCPPSFHLSF